jgi:hypothetical protein
VPAKPPTTFANYPCSENRTDTLCVPAYAYSVYQRCGYVWNKVGDTRDFAVWANELNGGTFSAWRRFVIPRWGGDIDPVSGLPDPLDSCMGVAFYGASTASALSCTCPAWLSSFGCFKIRVKWIAEPGSKPADCPQACWDLMATRWGTEETAEITPEFGGCLYEGTIGPFPVFMNWAQYTQTDCYWGPDVFDPCKPCEGFGKVLVTINSASGTGCGSANTAWMGFRFDESVLRGLVCDCGSGPIRIETQTTTVGPCGSLAEWIEIECCDP